MPIIGIVALSALGGLLLSQKTDSNVSLVEGIAAGAILGVAAAAIYFAVKKI